MWTIKHMVMVTKQWMCQRIAVGHKKIQGLKLTHLSMGYKSQDIELGEK